MTGATMIHDAGIALIETYVPVAPAIGMFCVWFWRGDR
jgi:hypothetical protein